MRLVTIRHGGRAIPGLLKNGSIHAIRGHADVISVLGAKGEPDHDPQPLVAEAEAEFLPPVPNPGKIVCVGLNYEEHRIEANRPKAAHPTIFIRWPDTQVGHRQPLLHPGVSQRFDYEAELALVIGRPGRFIPAETALDHVAGYAPYNEGSVRDFQTHTSQYTAGKNFPASGSFGPALVVGEVADPSDLILTLRLNGEVMQQSRIGEMIFKIPELIAYISTFTPLATGDVIVTGTPGGVGNRRDPQVFMKPGDVAEVEVTGLGTLSNTVVAA